MEYWLTFDGKKSSAEDKSKKKAQGAIEKFQRKIYSALTSDTRTRTYKLGTKHLAGLRQFAKEKFMHMGLSQTKARILGVKLHPKFTSIIGVVLNKGAWRQGKDYFDINSYFEKRGLKEEKTLNQRFKR